jgi:serine/threonine-protein kinase RsbW
MQSYAFELPNDGSKIEPLQEELQTLLQACGVRLKTVSAVILALGEWLENIIQHGYNDDAMHRIQVNCVLADNKITVTVTDGGRAFNPLEFPVLDAAVPTAERIYSGQGLHLIRKLMDEFAYERSDETNVFTMRKLIPARF